VKSWHSTTKAGLPFSCCKASTWGLVRPPIVFYAFDLRLNGEDLRGLPIEERKAKLAALLKNPLPAIRYSASFTENIDELLRRVRKLSLEGLIGKRAQSKYDSKRSPEPGSRSNFTSKDHL
jgi:bifunctional non-homologous end joining protein LigD